MNRTSDQTNGFMEPDADYAISSETSEETVTTSEDAEPVVEEIVYPGLILSNNYVLLRKIGAGNNATVWIAFQINERKYRAIKIQNYLCYDDGRREVRIIKKINEVCTKRKAEGNTDDTYLIDMLDFFVLADREDVKFICSVYELYAGSLRILLNRGKYKYGLPISVVKKMIKQLLTALATLHDSVQVVHTDIKPENILFKGMTNDYEHIIRLFEESGFMQEYEIAVKTYGDDSERLAVELDALAIESVKTLVKIEIDIYEGEEFVPGGSDDDEDDLIMGDDDIYSQEDDSEETSGTDGDYGQAEDVYEFIALNTREQSEDDTIEAMDYRALHDLDYECHYEHEKVLNTRAESTDNECLVDEKFIVECETAVTDFGCSYFYSHRTSNEVGDRYYRPPEVIMAFNYGYAADIWSVMCVTFELLTGYILFDVVDAPPSRDIHQLYLFEKYLGPIPRKLKKMSPRTRFLFDKERNYHIKNLETFTQVPLKSRLVNQFLFSETEADEIMDFLMTGLQYQPSKRHTAKQLLRHPWLADV